MLLPTCPSILKEEKSINPPDFATKSVVPELPQFHRHGKDHAQTLFGLEQIPTTPQIRNILDRIAAAHNNTVGGDFGVA